MFELQVNSVADGRSFDILLNGRSFTGQGLLPDWESMILSPATRALSIKTPAGVEHDADVVGTVGLLDPPGFAEDNEQRIRFQVTSIDGLPVEGLSFSVLTQPTASRRLLSLTIDDPLNDEPATEFDFFKPHPIPNTPANSGYDMASNTDDVSSLLAVEFEDLRLLENEAETIRIQIDEKKRIISQHLRDRRDNASLRQLLNDCDGLICAARVIAQRICDKVGMDRDLSEFSRMGSSRSQNIIANSGVGEKLGDPRNCTQGEKPTWGQKYGKHTKGKAQGMSQSLVLTKNETGTEMAAVDLAEPSNALVRVLAIIAGILGITALIRIIHRKCMPMRKRVDRLADREEKRNARAYRRAARRAEMRRRWDALVKAINCFCARPEPRIEDYEEKRALILQDAFLEQLEDLENAERGEIMEAEIRELRHAHEIVSSLVRTDQPNRYDLIAPLHDPPPPLVPLPYAPASRSRASSHTLPEYSSEILPDYASQPEGRGDSESSGSVAGGSRSNSPPNSDDGSLVTPPSSITGEHRRYSPTSSIVETSPRPSQETLMTRRSKDTQGL